MSYEPQDPNTYIHLWDDYEYTGFTQNEREQPLGIYTRYTDELMWELKLHELHLVLKYRSPQQLVSDMDVCTYKLVDFLQLLDGRGTYA